MIFLNYYIFICLSNFRDWKITDFDFFDTTKYVEQYYKKEHVSSAVDIIEHFENY
jgi:hypothetical protein